ncbi:ABC transporter ATP-binding protein [Clostridium sp. D2Q-11]|uniref:Spermidine/putrescine import ATP-binding protein PotA n=1 Tax=Anaeromonas frigoriresistens TaxID=2683708 RepID=A0A942ZAD8_9FIRM|nr:spermidine/putrescine ABC transporter ATP-binding protein [Anaeromonas frigoriresistens]MBS4540144.1 ABC transporter ATP-binding protein [Anaeromonas frigoriresistens]
MENHIIKLEELQKEYSGTKVLKNIDLKVKKNEFLTLLGPSGCGKTTTLRIIGGFELPTKGNVYFDGDKINDVPPYKRQINTVFQKYALFPHMNIFENIAFGLKIKKISQKEIKQKVSRMLRLVGLEGYENREINSLSGGQQQRIAIARALVNEPQVLLLDEPLGALDLKLRKEMQIELKSMQREVGITFIYVTHDQEEALTMSDTIVVMDKGKIQQKGTPVDIYNEPENRFVAKFIGESNIIEGVMIEDYLVEFCGKKFKCVDKGFLNNQEVDVVIRPEDIKLVSVSEGMLKGIVTSVIFKGVHYEMIIKEGEREWLVHNTLKKDVGSKLGILFNPEDIHVMNKERN